MSHLDREKARDALTVTMGLRAWHESSPEIVLDALEACVVQDEPIDDVPTATADKSPMLPTDPYTLIRAHLGGLNGEWLMLLVGHVWVEPGDGKVWNVEDIELVEMVSEPRAVTAKAVLDRVRHEYNDDDAVLRKIARDFGAES